jgi:hypothetical protein
MTEETAPKEAPNPKFVAFLANDDGRILIRMEGLTIEEAAPIVEKGRIQFQHEYELYLRRTLK